MHFNGFQRFLQWLDDLQTWVVAPLKRWARRFRDPLTTVELIIGRFFGYAVGSEISLLLVLFPVMILATVPTAGTLLAPAVLLPIIIGNSIRLKAAHRISREARDIAYNIVPLVDRGVDGAGAKEKAKTEEEVVLRQMRLDDRDVSAKPVSLALISFVSGIVGTVALLLLGQEKASNLFMPAMVFATSLLVTSPEVAQGYNVAQMFVGRIKGRLDSQVRSQVEDIKVPDRKDINARMLIPSAIMGLIASVLTQKLGTSYLLPDEIVLGFTVPYAMAYSPINRILGLMNEAKDSFLLHSKLHVEGINKDLNDKGVQRAAEAQQAHDAALVAAAAKELAGRTVLTVNTGGADEKAHITQLNRKSTGEWQVYPPNATNDGPDVTQAAKPLVAIIDDGRSVRLKINSTDPAQLYPIKDVVVRRSHILIHGEEVLAIDGVVPKGREHIANQPDPSFWAYISVNGVNLTNPVMVTLSDVSKTGGPWTVPYYDPATGDKVDALIVRIPGTLGRQVIPGLIGEIKQTVDLLAKPVSGGPNVARHNVNPDTIEFTLNGPVLHEVGVDLQGVILVDAYVSVSSLLKAIRDVNVQTATLKVTDLLTRHAAPSPAEPSLTKLLGLLTRGQPADIRKTKTEMNGTIKTISKLTGPDQGNFQDLHKALGSMLSSETDYLQAVKTEEQRERAGRP